MQRLYRKRKEPKKEEQRRQLRRIRESVAVPAALQLGDGGMEVEGLARAGRYFA